MCKKLSHVYLKIGFEEIIAKFFNATSAHGMHFTFVGYYLIKNCNILSIFSINIFKSESCKAFCQIICNRLNFFTILLWGLSQKTVSLIEKFFAYGHLFTKCQKQLIFCTDNLWFVELRKLLETVTLRPERRVGEPCQVHCVTTKTTYVNTMIVEKMPIKAIIVPDLLVLFVFKVFFKLLDKLSVLRKIINK